MQGRSDEAMEFYLRASQIWPEYPDAHHNLANEYDAMGDLNSAIAHWKKALEFEAGKPQALKNLAFALTESRTL